MILHLNGESREFPIHETITELIEALALPPATVLVEHNGLALRRDEWAQRELATGDRVEIIRIVAGG